MSNSDFIELCKDKQIFDPMVLGFIFNPPILNYKPPMIFKNGIVDPDHLTHISSCCFSCAYDDYFPKTIDQIKKDNGFSDDNPEDQKDLLEDYEYLTATFPKELLNTGKLITLNDANLEDFDYEWECDICESTSVY